MAVRSIIFTQGPPNITLLSFRESSALVSNFKVELSGKTSKFYTLNGSYIVYLIMAQKGHLKLVDKFQFNENKFDTVEGIEEFEAVHIESKNAYTLKRVGLNSAAQREQSARILHELTILKKLSHRLVPRCHKLLKTSNNMYLIFDRIAGCSLQHFIATQLTPTNWRIRLRECFKMAEDLCEIVAYLADRRICHSYIAPHNILVEGQVLSKLTAFGFALELQNSQSFLEIESRERPTDQYCAPEVRGGKVTLKSDVFSAGVILENLFTVLREMGSSNSSPQSEEVSIDRALSFCRKKMKSAELALRATAREAHAFFKQRQYQDPKEEHAGERDHLTLTDPGARLTHLQDDRVTKQRSLSPISSGIRLKKAQFSQVGSETQEYFLIARKVLHKRNLAELLLQLCDFCSSAVQSSSQRSLPICFLLLKKSTSIVSQLAKFLETGRGEGLRMDLKIRERLKKHKLFANLEKIIHTEMTHLQERLVSSVHFTREELKPIEANQLLEKELEVQSVDNDYLRRCICDFQEEIHHWTSSEGKGAQVGFCKLISKKQKVLLFLLGLLADYRTIQQLFEDLFSESGCSLWRESFMVTMMGMDELQIDALIIQQGRINPSKPQDACSSSSPSVATSRRVL